MIMVNKFVNDIASQLGMKISKVSVSGGLDVDCRDFLLEIESNGHKVKTTINQSEIESIKHYGSSGFLDMKIKTALERLKIQLEP